MKTSLISLNLLEMSVTSCYTSVLLFNSGYFRIKMTLEYALYFPTQEFEIYQKNYTYLHF